MSLFDLVSEEEKKSYEVQYPNVPEYSKELRLGFEKEVLGIYLSGHPLEEYEEKWRKNISAVTTDFIHRGGERHGKDRRPADRYDRRYRHGTDDEIHKK